MVCRVDLRVGGCDPALLIDQIADAHWVACVNVAAGTVCHSNFAVRIAQQLEREGILFCKRSVRGDIVEANAQNDDAAIFKSAVLVAEPATLAGSASRISLRIEPQQHFASAQG
jgi:hypothetical protein